MSQSIHAAAHLAIMWPFVARGMPMYVEARMRLVLKVLFFDRMSVLTGCCHAQIEVFHHWVSSGHPKNGHGSPTGQRLFATKLALLGRRRALRETPFLHVRVQSQASDGAAPGSSWP